ncbi:MAG: hypothetical protein ACREBC_30510 [Pyrinomonadaceae bacterium]
MHTKSGDTPEPERPPPVLKKDWRFFTGMAALILSLVMPVFVAFVPLLGLSVAQSAVIAGLLIVGGPEVAGLIGIALLGRNAFQYLSYRTKKTCRGTVIKYYHRACERGRRCTFLGTVQKKGQ